MSNFALTWQQVRILEKIPSKPQSARGIGEDSGIDYSTLMSAFTALSEQGLVDVSKEERQVYELTAEGKDYLGKGTPERRLYLAVSKSGEAGLEAAYSAAGLADAEKGIALQWAKKNGWLDISGGALQLTELGKRAVGMETSIEDGLREVSRVGSAPQRQTAATAESAEPLGSRQRPPRCVGESGGARWLAGRRS